MRRIRGIILTIALISAFACASAASAESFENRIGLLRAMGLIDVFDNDADMDAVVTRAEFATIVENFAGDSPLSYTSYYTDVPKNHWAAEEISKVTRSGFMVGDEIGRFSPEDAITGDNALTVCVKILGYQALSENSGGYVDGYLQAAYWSGLGGFGLIGSEDMTRRQVCNLIFKMLDCKVMDIDSFSGGNAKYSVSNETLLKAMFNICEHKGRITATPVTGLTSAEGISRGGVEIDNAYYYTEYDVIDSIGKYMYFYYVDNEDDKTVIYMYEDESKDESLVIKSGDIENYANYVYTYTSDNREKNASLSLGVSVIFNGCYIPYDELAKSDFTPADGEVRLISTGGKSNVYDIAIITSYEYYTVQSVGTANSMIYDKYGLEPLDMDTEDPARYISFTAYGKAVALSYFKENDVLKVQKSKDQKFIEMSMVTDKITGKPERINRQEDTVTIDGITYDTLRGLTDVAVNEYGKILREAVTLNSQGNFFLNENGVIVGYIPSVRSDETIGLLLSVKYVPDEFGYEACMIKMLSMDEPKTYMTTEKIYYTDPVTGKRTRKTAEELYGIIPRDSEMRTEREIYLFKVNEEGYLTELIPPKDMTEDTKYQGYSVDAFAKDWERKNVRIYTQKIGTRYIPDSSTKVFRVPYDASADIDAYEVGTMSMFSSDSRGNHVVVYGSNSDAAPKAVLVWTEDIGSSSGNIDNIIRTNPMIIISVEKTIMADDEIGYVIKGYQGGTIVEKETTNNVSCYSVKKWGYSNVKVEDLGRGDIIMYDTNSQGKMTNFLPLLRANDKESATKEVVNTGTIEDYDAIAVLHTLYGEVVRNSSSTITVNARDDMAPLYNRTYAATSANVILVKDKTIEKISLGDIEKGDEIFIRDYHHSLLDIVIYR